MPDRIESISCPLCGALLDFNKIIKENDKIFNVCVKGHKILRSSSRENSKGRAFLLELIYDTIKLMREFVKKNIFLLWMSWHFLEMPKSILKAWGNYLGFGLNYFSVGLLFKTLFSPWRNYMWFYPKAFDLGKYFEVAFSNLISRVLGFLPRIILIIVGVLFEALVAFFGVLFFVIWLILPVILTFGIYHGIRLSI